MVLPDDRPRGRDDEETLRWAARSDSRSGFIFVSNHERLKTLPAKSAMQFRLKLTDGETLTFPASPFDVPSDACFIWPFNLDLGGDTTLAWATADQSVSVTIAASARTFSLKLRACPAGFAIKESSGSTPQITTANPDRIPFWEHVGGDGRAIQLVLLSKATRC